MKRIKYIIYALIFSILFIPNVYAKENIEIKSIELEEKSESTTILSEPTFKGLDMNFSIAFKTKDDYARYKVIVKNNTDNVYQISEETNFNDSQYVKYNYTVESELKAQEEAVLHVTITYEKEVEETLMVNNKYSENTKATVQLLDDKGNVIEIPDTFKNVETWKVLLIVGLSLILAITVEVMLVKGKKNIKTMMGLLLLFAIIPVVNAIETLKLNINLNVEIEKGYEVSYSIHYSGIIPASEKDNYNVSDMDCSYTYYVGGMEEENKYLGCNITTVIKDPRLYSAGEILQLPVKEINTLSTVDDAFENVTGMVRTYYASDSSALQEDTILLNSWRYKRNDEVQAENELEIIDPDSIIDNYWNSTTIERHIALNTPGTIKMPPHDVIFWDNLPRK